MEKEPGVIKQLRYTVNCVAMVVLFVMFMTVLATVQLQGIRKEITESRNRIITLESQWESEYE